MSGCVKEEPVEYLFARTVLLPSDALAFYPCPWGHRTHFQDLVPDSPLAQYSRGCRCYRSLHELTISAFLLLCFDGLGD